MTHLHPDRSTPAAASSKPLWVLGLLAAMLAGCTQAPQTTARADADRGNAADGAVVDGGAAAGLARRVAASRGIAAQGAATTSAAAHFVGASQIATLPDRGELAEFLPQPPVRDGAYTWHAVRMSEAHAFASIAGGTITVHAPDGARLVLQYDRHEEHPNGDWTWIGHLAGTQAALGQALITFGRDAVFGELRQADPAAPPLKLSMRQGQLVMGEATAASLRAYPPRVPNADDALVPDYRNAPARSASTEAATPPVEAWTTAKPIVDVMIGYTATYRDAVGSASATVTRINFLIDVMNAALETSEVPGRVRLVHTQPVTYQDAEIYKTLDLLTGNGVAVPASLQPLHGVLRDRYGADLVLLLMGDYAGNQGGACGLGWQPGARDKTPPIDAATDQAYGFAVINKVCDDAVRHELGHNLGLSHDQITDAGRTAGPYPYSYGYKTTEPDGVGFHDVMAYGDPGQPVYNYYSNPRLRIKGIPAGTGSKSDASRSLKNTMQYTAAYRATKVFDGVRIRNDVNGDGKSDLLLHNFNANRAAFWQMSGSTVAAMPPSKAAPANGRLVASGDFNGDGLTDLVWLDSKRALWLWRSTGSTWNAYKLQTAGLTSATSIVGAADLDGDQKDELLLVSPSNSTFTYWKLSGTTVLRGRTYTLGAGTQLVATGDLNGDGKQDLVWMSSSRQLFMWWSNGGDLDNLNLAYALIDQPIPSGWAVVGAADFDGDGRGDLLFHNASTAQAVRWTMNRNLVTAKSSAISVGAGTTFGATGDFNGDGYADAVWRNGADLYMWFSDGKTFPWQNRKLGQSLAGSWHIIDGGVGGR